MANTRAYTREEVTKFFILYLELGENVNRAATRLGYPPKTCQQWILQSRWQDDLANARLSVSKSAIAQRNHLLKPIAKALKLAIKRINESLLQPGLKPSDVATLTRALMDAQAKLDSMARLDDGKATSRSERTDTKTKDDLKTVRDEIEALQRDPTIKRQLSGDTDNTIPFRKRAGVRVRKGA